MEIQKLIELLRKAYLSGVMEKELSDKMQGFKHDFESMATNYAEIEVNNGVLDAVSSEAQLLPKRLSNQAYKKANSLFYGEFVAWWDSQV